MGQEEAVPLPAATVVVAASWEPAVLKAPTAEQDWDMPPESPSWKAKAAPARRPSVVVAASWPWEAAVKAPAAEEDWYIPPESPKKAKAAPARRPSVPPPPGRPSSVPGSRSFSRGRAVRPEDDPFLAAYLACTRTGGSGRWNGGGGVSVASRPEPNKGRRRFTWTGLGLSCKGSGAAVEQSMVKLAKRPEMDPRDA